MRLMPVLARRALVAALIGAALGAALLGLANLFRPAVGFEMDRHMPSSITGFYGPELDGQTSFSWTADRAVIRLSGLDRRSPWRCVIRFRGARQTELPQPTLRVAVDGAPAAEMPGSNDYQDLELTLARRSRAGASVTLVSAPTFVPPGDPRELGVQVDRIACVPERAWVLPSLAAVGAASAGTAALAAGAVLAGGSLPLAIALAAVLAAGQSALLTAGAAQYGPFVSSLLRVGSLLPALMVLAALTMQLPRRRALQPAALAVLGVTTIAATLKVLGLLHPSKAIVDALFQAHRLEWVLEGRYFFTQPMPDGVAFPYAIALYVFAAPWTLLTDDFVSLLRTLVVGVDVVTGALLYLLVVRAWGLPRVGVWAVVLFHLVPLPYVVVSNGNLTNAFGQAAALATMAAAVLAPPDPRRVRALVGVSALAALAFCSHVSTLALLGAGLAALAVAFAAVGGRLRRAAALGVIVATAAALTFSVVTYYRHFTDVFTFAAERVTGGVEAGAPMEAGSDQAAESGPPREAGSSDPEAPAAGFITRLLGALYETMDKLGWPMLALAAAGGLGLLRARARDDLTCAVVAWMAVWVAFVLTTVTTRVGPEYERYAVEFIGRVNLATYPAAVLLAARVAGRIHSPLPGESRSSMDVVGRVLAFGVLAACAWIGIRAWVAWFIQP